jgi:hypothetical protein
LTPDLARFFRFLRKKARTFVLFGSVLAAPGCITHVAKQCPDCAFVDGVSHAPNLRPKIARLFVLVPGALGYGWEWDAAVAALRKANRDFVVFWWEPWNSLRQGANHLREVLQTALYIAPSLTEIVVVAHSAGGILAAHGMAGLSVPAGRHLQLVTIGTPFAGMGTAPIGDQDDPLGSPAVFAVGGRFHHYPPLPPGVSVVEYTTSWPPDPVMEPRYGWQPAPPDIGPAGAKRIPVDPKLDHNFVVARVVEELLSVAASSPAGNASAATAP